MNENLIDKIASLCKRRGFIFPSSEIYGGLSNSYDYGPLGVELKNNIAQLWWKRFVQSRSDMVGIDAALIMNPKVWEASGHLKEFSDPLVECKKCHKRFRADQDGEKFKIKISKLDESISSGHGIKMHDVSYQISGNCDSCGANASENFTLPTKFNLMLKTFLGPTEEKANEVYFRPEIAQAMFVNFKQVLDTTRRRLPFGIASQGKAFRNEITPGNFIFRTREFNLMELEFFVKEAEWEKWFEYWQNEMKDWLIKDLGINPKKIHEVKIPDGERAHYSKKTVDFEYEYPFGQKELYGLAYRTDFDLRNHFKDAPYRDPDTGEEFWPHVIEPTFGLDRSILVTLLEAYREEQMVNGKEQRVYLKLPPKLAPYKAAVFPLLANKPELVKLAKKIHEDLLKYFSVAFDDRGNIGKRYYSQDEIGTPFCITVDFDSLENGDVTVRARDTAKQERVKIKELNEYLTEKLSK